MTGSSQEGESALCAAREVRRHDEAGSADFAGMEVKPRSDDDKVRLGTDIAVLKYLQEHGLLFQKKISRTPIRTAGAAIRHSSITRRHRGL
jgi:hypothetical protein